MHYLGNFKNMPISGPYHRDSGSVDLAERSRRLYILNAFSSSDGAPQLRNRFKTFLELCPMLGYDSLSRMMPF